MLILNALFYKNIFFNRSRDGTDPIMLSSIPWSSFHFYIWLVKTGLPSSVQGNGL